MDRVFLLTAMLLVSLFGYSQKIRFTHTSNKWTFIYKYDPNYDPRKYPNPTQKASIRQYFNGDSTVNGITYQKLELHNALSTLTEIKLVREDTTTEKVYQFVDSKEVIYMDYKWKVGDKIHDDNWDRYIDSIDTISIAGYAHKIFYITAYQTDIFIEGLGFIYRQDIFSLVIPYCFSSKGQKPVISKFFEGENQLDCSSSALFVKNTTVPTEVSIYPQPAQEKVQIILPTQIPNGLLVLRNELGQIVLRKEIRNEHLLEIDGAYLKGMYFYNITDNTNHNIYLGKMIFAN